MKRLEITIDDPARAGDPRRPVGFDDPNEAHRFADEQARKLATDCVVLVYDTEARDFCGHYRGRGEPADTADDLAALFASSARV